MSNKYELRFTMGNERFRIACHTSGQMIELYKDMYREYMPEMYYNMGADGVEDWIPVAYTK